MWPAPSAGCWDSSRCMAEAECSFSPRWPLLWSGPVQHFLSTAVEHLLDTAHSDLHGAVPVPTLLGCRRRGLLGLAERNRVARCARCRSPDQTCLRPCATACPRLPPRSIDRRATARVISIAALDDRADGPLRGRSAYEGYQLCADRCTVEGQIFLSALDG